MQKSILRDLKPIYSNDWKNKWYFLPFLLHADMFTLVSLPDWILSKGKIYLITFLTEHVHYSYSDFDIFLKKIIGYHGYIGVKKYSKALL